MMREYERSEGESHVNQTLCNLGWLALGAGLMYAFDPQYGRRRRSVVRGKLTGAAHGAQAGLGKTAQYTWGSTKGLWHETRKMFTSDQPDDQTLVARVRSALGRAVSHPSAIDVTARDGVVCLCGPVLADEEDNLLRTVASVRGVEEVINELEPHSSRGDLPALQGGAHRTGQRYGVMQENWPPSTRLIASALGASAALYGLARRGAVGGLMLLGGGALLARGLTNLPARRLVGVGAGRRAVDVQKTINVNAPIERVFDFFADYANFPHFMRNVREVRDHGSGRSHWVVAGPLGAPVEWDADITRFVQNELIAWKSVEGSTVENAGVIHFQPNEGGGTRVHIRLSYNPPAGAIGHLVAKVFGADPKHEMDQDLLRVKTTLESGHPPHDAAQPVMKAQTV